MVAIFTDNHNSVAKVKDLVVTSGFKPISFPIDMFKEGLKGDVDLIIYDIYNLTPMDVENIHLARRVNIPLILITAYPGEWAMGEISKLWRYNYVKDYLIRPKIEKLTNHLSTLKVGVTKEW